MAITDGPLPFPSYIRIGMRLVLTTGMSICVRDVRGGRVYSSYSSFSSWPVEMIDMEATIAADKAVI